MVAADTIVATATPYGFSAIAIVRLSGPAALDITRNLAAAPLRSLPDFLPRTAVRTLVYCQQAPIDETLVTFFPGPNSYTGEDTTEISCHGSPTITEAIIAEACRLGARLAEPGEFTRRAFLNGKIDLIQAEAVAGLIQARSAESSQLNLRLLRGNLSGRLNTIKQNLIGLLAQVEFELDISEEGLNPNLEREAVDDINRIVGAVNDLIKSYHWGRLLNRGANVVIIGAPNVGKSTLLNALVESDRAIVSHLPGTTRDSLDVPLLLDGVPINLIDTAGLRETTAEIEQEGVRRTLRHINDADLLLAVFEPPNFDQPLDFDRPSAAPLLNVFNKSDLLLPEQQTAIRENHPAVVLLSAKEKIGINYLKTKIKEQLNITPIDSGEISLTTLRQLDATQSCAVSLKNALGLFSSGAVAFELVALELRTALSELDRLLGKTTADDLLNHIFNTFCVGK